MTKAAPDYAPSQVANFYRNQMGKYMTFEIAKVVVNAQEAMFVQLIPIALHQNSDAPNTHVRIPFLDIALYLDC